MLGMHAYPGVDVVWLQSLGVFFQEPREVTSVDEAVGQQTSLGIIGFECMSSPKAGGCLLVLVHFEIVNSDPRMLWLLACDRANRSCSLRAGFGVVDQDEIETFEIEFRNAAGDLAFDESEGPAFVDFGDLIDRLAPRAVVLDCVQTFEMRKGGAIEKRERAVIAAAKLEHVFDLAHAGEADQNREIRGVVVERAGRRKIFHTKPQRKRKRHKGSYLCDRGLPFVPHVLPLCLCVKYFCPRF